MFGLLSNSSGMEIKKCCFSLGWVGSFYTNSALQWTSFLWLREACSASETVISFQSLRGKSSHCFSSPKWGLGFLSWGLISSPQFTYPCLHLPAGLFFVAGAWIIRATTKHNCRWGPREDSWAIPRRMVMRLLLQQMDTHPCRQT